tara:strand:+ start:74 stop:1201 length:1128 start_codon:yes stop_codon:yes gene_type:complete
MALTEIPVELSSTPGIADSSNATAITIDSSERLLLGRTAIHSDTSENNYYSKIFIQGNTSSATGDAGITVARGEAADAANNLLGRYLFSDVNGGDGASVDAYAESAWGTDSFPTYMTFSTSTTRPLVERLRINSAGNLGIGVTPEAYGSGYKALDIGSHSGIMAGASGSAFYLNENSYWDGSNFKAKNTAAGSNYLQTNGEHRWSTMASVSADANQTVTRVMTVDTAGHVTMPLQPAFQATTSVAVEDIGTNGAENTVKFGNQVFDQNGDFDDSTFTFTAPVTGKYQLQVGLFLGNVDSAATYIRTTINTSNRNYHYIEDPNFSADKERHMHTVVALGDMDANDTAHVTLGQYEGTAQMDATATTESVFSGYLVA